jgi:hypothetical protein
MRSVSDTLLLGAAGAAGGSSYNGYVLLSLNSDASNNYPVVLPYSTDSGFGAALYPSAAPGNTVNGAVFSPDKLAIFGCYNSSPYIFAYEWTGTAWGTRYTNIANAGTSSVLDITVSPNSDFICYAESKQFPTVYPWNSSTGFGSRIRDTVNSVANSPACILNNAGTIAIFGTSITSPYIKAFPVSSSAISAPLSNPASALPSASNGLAINSSDSVVAAATGTTPFINAYAWSNSTGFGTKYSNPSTLPPAGADDCAFNPDGTALAVTYSIGGADKGLKVYPWSDSTGFGTPYSDPSAQAPLSRNRIKFAPDGKSLIVVASSSPYIIAYEWSDLTGFGAAYSTPSFTAQPVNDVDFYPE